MKIFRITRAWWLIAGAVVVLVVAGPTAGSPMPNDWSFGSTPNPGVYGNIIWGMSARTDSDVWAVGVQETLTSNDTLALHWDGTSWAAVPTPNPSASCEDGNIQWGGQELGGVDALSANDAWAVGSDCYSSNALIEHWNGTSWSLVASPRLRKARRGFDSTAALYGVAAISANNIWAVGYQGASGIETLVEHYNGAAWSVVPSAGGSPGYFSSVSATGPSDIWAVGGTDSGNLIQHFDGTSWTVVPSPQPSSGSGLDSVVAISPTDAWAVGSKNGSGTLESTFTVHWNGVDWTEVPSPNPGIGGAARNQLRSVTAISSKNVWAVGMYENEQTSFHQHRTLTLHWDGVSWSIVTSPTPGLTGELNAVDTVATSRLADTPRRLFAGGYFSYYERNIYDGHYTDPRTLVLNR